MDQEFYFVKSFDVVKAEAFINNHVIPVMDIVGTGTTKPPTARVTGLRINNRRRVFSLEFDEEWDLRSHYAIEFQYERLKYDEGEMKASEIIKRKAESSIKSTPTLTLQLPGSERKLVSPTNNPVVTVSQRLLIYPSLTSNSILEIITDDNRFHTSQKEVLNEASSFIEIVEVSDYEFSLREKEEEGKEIIYNSMVVDDEFFERDVDESYSLGEQTACTSCNQKPCQCEGRAEAYID